jgi:molecular chaperone GrpE (heat shock protein)
MTEPRIEGREASATVPPEIVEIAEDMLQLLGRLAAVEQRQVELLARLDEVSRLIQETTAAQARALDALRRDLLGERSALAARATFTAVVPVLDSLRTMRQGLDPSRDELAYAQTTALSSSLSGLLQTLGFRPFEPAVGETFDPGRMECLGYAPGSPGLVTASLHPGYLAGSGVVRPAGVLIAPPRSSGGPAPAHGASREEVRPPAGEASRPPTDTEDPT